MLNMHNMHNMPHGTSHALALSVLKCCYGHIWLLPVRCCDSCSVFVVDIRNQSTKYVQYAEYAIYKEYVQYAYMWNMQNMHNMLDMYNM